MGKNNKKIFLICMLLCLAFCIGCAKEKNQQDEVDYGEINSYERSNKNMSDFLIGNKKITYENKILKKDDYSKEEKISSVKADYTEDDDYYYIYYIVSLDRFVNDNDDNLIKEIIVEKDSDKIIPVGSKPEDNGLKDYENYALFIRAYNTQCLLKKEEDCAVNSNEEASETIKVDFDNQSNTVLQYYVKAQKKKDGVTPDLEIEEEKLKELINNTALEYEFMTEYTFGEKEKEKDITIYFFLEYKQESLQFKKQTMTLLAGGSKRK